MPARTAICSVGWLAGEQTYCAPSLCSDLGPSMKERLLAPKEPWKHLEQVRGASGASRNMCRGDTVSWVPWSPGAC